jgi:hypothetical protein
MVGKLSIKNYHSRVLFTCGYNSRFTTSKLTEHRSHAPFIVQGTCVAISNKSELVPTWDMRHSRLIESKTIHYVV